MSSLADPNPANDSRRLASAAAKRKLDDYAPTAFDDEFAADLLSIRMRKDELYSVQHPHPAFAHASSSSSGRVPWPLPHSPLPSARLAFASRLQFFVRMISEGKTLVFQANSSDTVQSVHERIQLITGIPVIEQRLIYKGKQLQCEKSLAECAIQNDAGLHLVGRMQSTGHSQAWQIIDDMIYLVFRLCKGETVPYALKTIRTRISEYLSMTPKDDGDAATGHLQIFMSSSAPAALVMLYMSPIRGNKEHAEESIRHFLELCIIELPKSLRSRCAPIVLEFCKLLRTVLRSVLRENKIAGLLSECSSPPLLSLLRWLPATPTPFPPPPTPLLSLLCWLPATPTPTLSPPLVARDADADAYADALSTSADASALLRWLPTAPTPLRRPQLRCGRRRRRRRRRLRPSTSASAPEAVADALSPPSRDLCSALSLFPLRSALAG